MRYIFLNNKTYELRKFGGKKIKNSNLKIMSNIYTKINKPKIALFSSKIKIK